MTAREGQRPSQIAAAASTAAVLAGLLAAPAALGVAALSQAISRLIRWRPSWLAFPAGCGLAWTLAIGIRPALAGFLAFPHATLGALARAAADPALLSELPRAVGVGGRWQVGSRLAGQLPVGLMLGAVAAAVMSWLDRRGGRLAAGAAASRPGLVSWARRGLRTALIRSGGILTWDGVCLGVDPRGGGVVSLPWAQAERGVLITSTGQPGTGQPGAAACAFQFLHAAIRCRKPVIAVDVGGQPPGLVRAVSAACAAAGAPLVVFGTGGRYQPWQDRDPAVSAALIAGMVDWGGAGDTARAACVEVLAEAFSRLAEAPAGAGGPILDDLVRLLTDAAGAPVPAAGLSAAGEPGLTGSPSGLREPGGLRKPVTAAASFAAAQLAAAQLAAAQLAALRDSSLGCWLGPPGVSGSGGLARPGWRSLAPASAGPADLGGLADLTGPAGVGIQRAPEAGGGDGIQRAPGAADGDGARIDLAEAVRRRAVVLFPLGLAGDSRAARMVANLVALDVAVLCARQRREGARDGLVWFAGFPDCAADALEGLMGAAPGTGFAVVLAGAEPEAAAAFAASAGVRIEHQRNSELTVTAAPPAGLPTRRAVFVPGRTPGRAQ